MCRVLAGLVLFFSALVIVSSADQAQDVKAQAVAIQQVVKEPVLVAQAVVPKKDAAPVIHPRGYKRPANFEALLRASWNKHGHHLQAMPHVSIVDYDCRTLGIVTPVKDQGQCFPAGTQILMADGTKRPIESIRVGQSVITAHGQIGEVSRTFERKIDEEITSLSINGASVDLTSDHPVLTPYGYCKAGTLKVGDMVLHRTNKISEWAAVTQILKRHFVGPVYDLEVSCDNSYVANEFGVHNCGSCWCFAGTELCESALIKAGAMPLSKCILSTQYTLDCYQNGGCDGDNSQTVTDHAKSVGLPLEADYGPYQASAGRCKGGVALYKITDAGYVSKNQIASFQEIMDAMVKYGPIQVNIDAGCLDGYNGGVITSGDGDNVDHAVFAVGFHNDPAGIEKSYLIVQNSWGKSWGENGAFKIKPGIWSVGDGALWATATGNGPIPPNPPNPPGPGPGPGPLPVSPQIVTLTYNNATIQYDFANNVLTPPAGVKPTIAGFEFADISKLTPAWKKAVELIVEAALQDGVNSRQPMPKGRP